MGVVPQTVNNGLKPYGLIYDLLKNDQVPVKWVINQTKPKDGIDFSYEGVQYKGGTFIIPAEYRTTSVNNKIVSYGVTGTTTTSTLTVDVTYTLTAAPKWTLDDKNGSIAAGFFTKAGIPETAYNWKDPQLLDGCDDIFVMPHADPAWATHSNLYYWNRNNFGAIWAGCHAVSVLENMNNGTLQTNFLAVNVGAIGNALVPFGAHADASLPYTHQHPVSPAAQYMGVTDNAHTNGSEQVYLPKAGGGWRPTTQIIAYDPTQSNVPVLSPGPAAIIAFGRAFGNNNYGWVMYEAGHSINKASAPDNVAAQRAFWNFSFISAIDKVPNVISSSVPATVTGGVSAPVSVNAVSPVGGTLSYAWTSSCGGSFSNPNLAAPAFTPPTVLVNTTCVLKCVITDNCGRNTFVTVVTIITPPPANPVANNDSFNIDICAISLGGSVNVLTNDTDPNSSAITFTSLNLASASPAGAGTWTSAANGNVTFMPNTNFSGTATITYTITNAAGLTATAIVSAIVGTGIAPTPVNDAVTIAEDNIANINVLANDGAGLTLNSIVSNPVNGRVSVNVDGSVTYVPNADFAGTDSFIYSVRNTGGSVANATVTVTVTNDSCDSGTYAN
ncbi:hypothetical protein C7N43_36305 [Sphingobacteriales bacterium UPWRP_1]|nr:hypothetical protein C7N43_36305 [Sphingobacteriales bacterium UPWRP_1]